MDTAKEKINTAFRQFVLFYPEEYEAVKRKVSYQRGTVLDHKFAEVQGSESAVERYLGEYPARLYEMMHAALDDDEKAWMTKEGQLWFFRTYPEFTVPEKV